ncbi:TPA: hypothetical protein I8Z55_000360 [Legionella pneumophila]|nr:hypothetical protein [Legionella pneumophila]
MNEKLTIIPSDGAVYVDGLALFGFDLSFIPQEVHALQWMQNMEIPGGWIEYKGLPNEPIEALPDWANQALTLWQIKYDEINNPPAHPLTQNDFIKAIKQHLDKKAQEKNYESEYSIASYTDSTNQQWKLEAQSFVIWRDSVWLYAYSELALIQSGEKPVPTIEEFIQSLPDLNW